MAISGGVALEVNSGKGPWAVGVSLEVTMGMSLQENLTTLHAQWQTDQPCSQGRCKGEMSTTACSDYTSDVQHVNSVPWQHALN